MMITDFQRESYRIDQMIWDAMALLRGERVLFCGFANDGAWVKRAAEIGVDVHVIESDEDKLTELTDLRVKTLRGSTTMIPARDNSFDAVVAFHYLHEIDPTFHAQIVSEIARVGKRVVVVEPAPPADALGKRIAELYSRAKFEAGAFEEYQPIDYWRKLLAMVKADVVMQQFTFTRLAPRFAIEETVSLILEAMEIEEMPEGYLRELARQPDAQLSPLSRLVLVGAPAGRPIRATAGTLFREVDTADAAQIAAAVRAVAAAVEAQPPAAPAPGMRPAAAAPGSFASYMDDAEFPPVLPPVGNGALPAGKPGFAPPPAQQPAAQQPPAHQPPAQPPAAPPPPAAPFGPTPFAPAAAGPAAPRPPAEVPFGMPPPEVAPFGIPAPGAAPAFGIPDATPFGIPPGKASPFGTPFALPDDPDPFGLSDDPEARAGYGWTWEPPDAQSGESPFDASDPFGTRGS
jgi:ubiquinone/menaquinone biosynthesis C-methylase UbiE